jgi:hypothetical protein
MPVHVNDLNFIPERVNFNNNDTLIIASFDAKVTNVVDKVVKFHLWILGDPALAIIDDNGDVVKDKVIKWEKDCDSDYQNITHEVTFRVTKSQSQTESAQFLLEAEDSKHFHASINGFILYK